MEKPTTFPKQTQSQPGDEHEMTPEPQVIRDDYKGSDKLSGKVALITGGDSGIGRSVAVHFAREGADVAIIYLDEDEDAEATKHRVVQEGRQCLLLRGDIRDSNFCRKAVEQTREKLGNINVLVNNAAVQYVQESLIDIDDEQLHKTFETNIYSMFYLTRAVLPYMQEGDVVINTTSVTAYRGMEPLVDYSSTKGAITSFTRSLAKQLAEKKIRVNAVAPGPVWTPLIPASFDDVEEFGQETPMGRAGQPSELGPAYVFLACADSSYVTGQVIHVNGGEVVGA